MKVIKVMEHVWQGTQKHAAGSFDIAKDLAGLRPGAYLHAIFAFPFVYRHKKLFPVCLAVNRSYLEKDFSQLSGIWSLGRGPAPGQSLPLNVDQASLHYDARPQLAQDVYYVRVAINCKAARPQAVLYKRLKKGYQLWLGVLRDRVLPHHDLVILGLHQGNQASRTMQESPVQNEVLAFTQAQQRLRRRLFEIVVNHTVQLCRAVSALIGQLPDRIAFSHPQPEPLPLSCAPCGGIMPANRLSATWTKPALFPITIMTISL